MRFEMWKSKAQKGAFLVFTALMIPIIFLCAGFAVDLGNAWAYKSKLQNAADAAVLAGAYQYQADSNDKKKIEERIDKYMNANNGGIPFSRDKKDDSKNGIFYRFPTAGSTAKGLLLTLHVSEEAPTTFSKMFGFGSLHVAVVSTARILPSSGGGNSGGNDAFSYAMIGAASKKSDIIRKINPWNRHSVYFHSNDVIIDGKIYANDSVACDGPEQIFITNENNFSTSEKYNDRLWSFGNGYVYYDITLEKDHSKHIVAENHYVDLKDSPADITLSKSNPITSEIYKFIKNQETTYLTNGSQKYDEPDNIYISEKEWHGNHPWEFDFQEWHPYKVIIAYGNINLSDRQFDKIAEYGHITVISLHGNIDIAGSPPSGSNEKIKGLFYAPEGYIDFKTSLVSFEGSMVAQQIINHGNGISFKWNRFDFPGGGESSPGSIKLYADIDSDYEPTT